MLSLNQFHFPILSKTDTILTCPVMQEREMHSTCHYSEEQTDYSLPSPAAKSTSDLFLPALRKHLYLKVFRNQLLKLHQTAKGSSSSLLQFSLKISPDK